MSTKKIYQVSAVIIGMSILIVITTIGIVMKTPWYGILITVAIIEILYLGGLLIAYKINKRSSKNDEQLGKPLEKPPSTSPRKNKVVTSILMGTIAYTLTGIGGWFILTRIAKDVHLPSWLFFGFYGPFYIVLLAFILFRSKNRKSPQ